MSNRSQVQANLVCLGVIQVTKEVCQAGGEAIAVAGDVTAEDFPRRVVSAAVDAFGGIDILINNAGRWSPQLLWQGLDGVMPG